MKIITSNPYNKTHWKNRVRDPITQQIVEEGVPFTESRANNFEEGIYNAYMYIMDLQNELVRTQIQLAAIGRAPGNAGAITDTLDGSSINLVRQTAIADIIREVAAGTTVLPVDSIAGFEVGTEVTILDGTNYEVKAIQSINEADKTITVSALQKLFSKGAKVAESSLFMDVATKTLKYGTWGTFTVSVSEVV
ncbi:hypothetical protein NYE67_20400 [Solibacillus sp. FSL W8-0474]|uniref:hypothetical protein n=1 Tax=Solibacillus sp. FSL W8-0474 TaxID=2975336 RepID=UPI0030F84EC6